MFASETSAGSERSALRWGAVFGAAALVGCAWFAGRWYGIDWSVESLRRTVGSLGAWSPLAFIALLGMRSLLLLPAPLMLIAAGLIFGAPAGALWGALGLTLSALLQYGLVRWIGSDALAAQLGPAYGGAIRVARTRAGSAILALVSMYPAGPPITAAQLAAAIAGMRPPVFLGAVLLGSSVRASSYAWLGSALLEGRDLLAAGALLLALAGFPLLLPATRAWLLAVWRGERGSA